MRIYKNIVLITFFLLICSSMTKLQAQQSFEDTRYQVYSIFIYNFTKYIQWPDEYNSGEFIIGVFGETKLIKELDKLAQLRNVNGRKIVVKTYNSIKEVDAKCHILFIDVTQSNNLSDVLEKTKTRSMLIVTNKDGLGKTGSLINFTTLEGKPTFEMNVSAIEKRNLKFAQQLKTLAIVI